jgi:hypothetical protein
MGTGRSGRDVITSAHKPVRGRGDRTPPSHAVENASSVGGTSVATPASSVCLIERERKSNAPAEAFRTFHLCSPTSRDAGIAATNSPYATKTEKSRKPHGSSMRAARVVIFERGPQKTRAA